MQPHQQRVVDELNELQIKVTALRGFIHSPKFSEIVEDNHEQIRLKAQLDVMKEYAYILKTRIDNFK